MNKFFSLLAGLLFFVSAHAARYGVYVVADLEENVEKLDAVISEMELEFIGLRIQEPNYPVFEVKNYMYAQKVLAVLKINGYNAEIIEVHFDNEPNATVLSMAAIEQIMQAMAPTLESLEGVEDLDEVRARLTEAFEKELAAAQA